MLGGLPVWVQAAWVVFNVLIMIGAAIWTLFFLLPYFRRMEAKTDAMLRLAVDQKDNFKRTSDELRDALQSLATAQKMGMGLSVLSSFLPLVLDELTGKKKGKKP